MWMQVALGVHALVGAGLVLLSCIVTREGTDVLGVRLRSVDVFIASLVWLMIGWYIARARPMPSYDAQPESRLRWGPPVAMLVFQLWAVGAIFGTTPAYPDAANVVTWLQFALWIAVPLCVLEWWGARIRFHAGTWALAWLISMVGLVATLACLLVRLPPF